MPAVVADIREERAGVPYVLELLGAAVDRRLLSAGDYVCGPETIVERQSVRDLHKSIAEGRFWRQIVRVRDAGQSAWLIIEGPRLLGGPIDADSIRGVCLAAADLGVNVVQTTDADDTARWLLRLADRRQGAVIRDRPWYAHRPRRTRALPPSEAALASAPGVSVATARALLAHFGSLEKVLLADERAWRSVRGVGPGRARAIHAMIHDAWVSDRPN